MAELKEDLKKVLAETFKENMGDSTSEDLPESVAKLKEDIETRIELESIGAEFLDKLKEVAFSRRQLHEAEKGLTDSLSVLQGAVNTLSGKLDELSELKKSNLALERKVLTDIDDMIKKNKVG
jgi:uncharacterized protein (DUF3084 family)